MKNSYRNVLVKIKEAEQKISWDSRHIIQESMKMAFLLRDLLTEIRESVMRDGFLDETDEIEFFKKTKPEILGKLLYYNKVFRIETSCPVCMGNIYQHYFSAELEKLEQNYKEHIGNSEFYRYYRSGNTDRDTVFFVRGNINLSNGLHGYIFESDPCFSTYYDHKVSRIIESDLLYEYLFLKVNEGMDNGILALDSGSEQMCWTESKNALIELIYALHASQCITNGQVGIRKVAMLFQTIFNVQLGDVHHAFHRMKVLAEKPSVAREIASILNAYEKKEGYIEGNGYAVTWALGHLVTLAMPEIYGIQGFQKENLPILPNPFILVARQVKKDKGYIPDAGVLKQLKVIGRLFENCEDIIVATDAGREGELIFRYIYKYLNCTKPFKRLWISSLTEKAICTGFEKLVPGENFDSLFHAAEGRSRADWLVGMNATQALSIAAGSGVYSLGRVQTPTLAMICKRYLENRDFAVHKYWQIQMEHRKEFINFRSQSVKKFESQKEADDLLKSIMRHNVATVQFISIRHIMDKYFYIPELGL